MLCLSKKMKMIMVAASFMTFTAGTAMVYAAPPPPDEPPAHHEAPPPKPTKTHHESGHGTEAAAFVIGAVVGAVVANNT